MASKGGGVTLPHDDDRYIRKSLLDDEIRRCRRCPDMNEAGVTQAAPGWGSINSAVAIVGQSLCKQCMEYQEPFYGGSGSLLDASFARVPVDRDQLFLTNAVHCHPRGNRASHIHEIANCSAYLYRELQIVRPRLVIGLGDDAGRVLQFLYPTAHPVEWPFAAPRNVRSKTVPCLHFAAHPSWIKRQHDPVLDETYVQSLVKALKWAFRKGPLEAGVPPAAHPAEP